MASNIDTSTLDENFPVAGRDNDTQGFRDNFGIIKNSLIAAKAEIEDLQDNAARKDTENDFRGSSIADADLIKVTEVMLDTGNGVFGDSGTIATISFNNGHYHRYNLDLSNNTVSFTLRDWPVSATGNRLAKITVELYNITNNTKTVSWNSLTSTGGFSSFKRSSNWPASFTVEGSNSEVTTPTVVEFWSYNGGVTVFANYLGKFE